MDNRAPGGYRRGTQDLIGPQDGRQQQPPRTAPGHQPRVQPDIDAGEHHQAGAKRPGVVPPDGGGHQPDQGQHPHVGRRQGVAQRRHRMATTAAEGHADQAAEHQLMQVQGIGLVHRHAPLEAAAPDGEPGFEDGVEQHGQRVERRYRRVAHHQQHGQFGQHETQEIRPPIAQEDAAERKIPDQETQRGRGQRRRDQEDRHIADLQRDQADGHGHQRGNHAGQAVHAVNDVQGVGTAAHGEHGEQQGNGPIRQDVVHGRHADTADATQQPPGDRGGQEGRQQALAGADVFGDVFEQARHEHGQRRHEQRRPQPGQGHVVGPEHQQTQERAGQHGQAADARRGARMVRLRFVEVAVAGEGAMPALRRHDESAHHERDHANVQPGHKVTFGWSIETGRPLSAAGVTPIYGRNKEVQCTGTERNTRHPELRAWLPPR
ncbi:hypothetical protein Ddc_19666 [Ditylenchus destructor]|nr:hypothetical protein Ddc_19666 [Ditylenchus destructor]